VKILLLTFTERKKEEDFDRELISEKQVIRVNCFILFSVFECVFVFGF